jgi:hypothetical protein
MECVQPGEVPRGLGGVARPDAAISLIGALLVTEFANLLAIDDVWVHAFTLPE